MSIADHIEAAAPEATQVESEAPAPAAPADGQQEEAQAESQQQDEAQGEQPQERDERGRFKGLQPRIDELTRKRYEAEREAAYWRGVATQGKAPQSAEQPSAAPAAPVKPTPDQFDNYADFVEALADFKADQKVAQAMSQQQAATARQQQASTWEQRQATARAAMPDYDAVVGASAAPVEQHVAEALVDSEHGPALAYHLAKHPEVLQRLNSLPQRQADRELGRIEAALSASPAPAPAAAAKTVSQAPAPIKPISQGASGSTKQPGEMSQAEYEAWRGKQGAWWSRR